MRAPWLLCLVLCACGDAGSAEDAGAQATRDAGAVLDARQTTDAESEPAPADAARVDSGGGSEGGLPSARYFPESTFMYQSIASAPLDPDSARITSWLRDNGGFGTGRMRIDFSIEVLEAEPGTPRRSFERTDDFYTPDCDPAPIPVPAVGALEGESGYACESDGDCHLIVVDRAARRLYEMWRADLRGSSFRGGCAAVWDMARVYGPELRGEQCSSADAAGLPIAPLLYSADEVASGRIDHAIRFILPNARMRARTYQHPATHAGGPSGPADAPIYGSRWRLKSSFDLKALPNEGARVVARALQQYGMILADGGNIALTAQSDRFTARKWAGLLGSDDLRLLAPTDFEIVQTGEPIALTFDCTRTPITD